MSTQPEVTIIIPCYNPGPTLSAVLQSIQDNTKKPLETIIVDSSPEDQLQPLTEQYPGVKILKLPQKTLPGIARNIGAQNALGEILLFCDSDVILSSRCIEEATEAYRSGKRIFGGALQVSRESSFPVGYLEHFFFNHESQRHRPEKKRKNLSSALMIIEKKLFLESGGFKEIPRMQDTEFTERLVSTGITLYFLPQIVGFQIQDSSFRKVIRKIYVNGNNLFNIRYKELRGIRKAGFVFLIPIISQLKIGRILMRNFYYLRGRERGLAVLLGFPLWMLIFPWMMGLYKGAIGVSGISSER